MMYRIRKLAFRFVFVVFVLLVLLFLIAPALVVIPLSFSGDAMTRFPPANYSLLAYSNFFTGPGWLNSAYFSLKMAAAVMVIAVVIGTATAYGMMKLRLRTRNLMALVVLLPITVPQIIYAIASYGLLADMKLIGTFAGFVIVNVVLATSYAVITVRNGMEGFDWSLVRAASVLGARPTRVALKIGLPLLASSLLAAALFTFLVAFDEVVVAQFISSPFANPLSKRMWDGILFRWDPAISAISTMQIGITVLVLAVVGLMGQRQARITGATAQPPI